jgi:hypothetical protein
VCIISYHCIITPCRYHIQGKEEWLGRTLVGQTLSDMRAAGIPDKYLKNLERYTSVGGTLSVRLPVE